MKLLCAAAIAACSAFPAFAQTAVTLDFEGAVGFVNAIDDFYNGGTDSLGNSGVDYGVSFTDAVVGLSNDELGPYYSNAPTPGTVIFAFDDTAVMNVGFGFIDRLTFAYSSSVGSLDAVKIWSGLNGTGTLLASASLFGNASIGCTDTAFCRFDLTSVEFAGLAKSISFAGNAPNVLYDDITITAVPEPSTYALLAAGLLAIGYVQRRRSV